MSRKIDRLIAERLMNLDGLELMEEFLPHYSTDIRAAWKVVEQFDNVEFHTNIDGRPFCRVWVAYLYYESRGEAESMPMAICLAALKANRIKVS